DFFCLTFGVQFTGVEFYNVFYFILWYSFAKKEYNILLYPKY
ncbi:hypothetical protein HMPREF3228_00328, partial [Streptococcus mitis]